MIYMVTKAYNAEATLRRTVESVLSQTIGDFRYHLCDNGSTDGTGDIVREYARQDKRIIPVFNERNVQYLFPTDVPWSEEFEKQIAWKMFFMEPGDWISILDADDDYTPDFLEEMLSFVQRENLDFAACPSNHIYEPEGISRNLVKLDEDIILEGNLFGTLYPRYYRYMCGYWAKMQSGRLFQRMDYAAFRRWIAALPIRHMNDTAMEHYFLRYSERAGVRAKMMHNFRQYPNSYSARSTEEIALDALRMPEIYRDYLTAKVGCVSEENERFYNGVIDRLLVRLGKERPQKEEQHA